jgi:phosphatidylglycerol:prolipoprotein diacylglycerol transferase
MIPTFGHVLGEPVPAYFVMLAIGFTTATVLGARWAKRSGLDHDVIIDLGLISVIAGVAGGRIMHVLADGYFWDYVHLCTDPARVVWHGVSSEKECLRLGGVWGAETLQCRPAARDCLAWAKFWSGGLTYYGGLIGASLFGIWFLKREAFPVFKALDMGGTVIPIGLFFGRLGCFFGGCCFGLRTNHWIGVSFPAGSPASYRQYEAGAIAAKTLRSLPVHPTQLYEALGCLTIYAVAALLVHPRKRFDGQVFCAFLALYAILRFGLEFLRADDRGGLLGLSTSQLVGLFVLAIVAVIWNRLSVRNYRAVRTSR